MGGLCARDPAQKASMLKYIKRYSRSSIVFGGESEMVDRLDRKIEAFSGLERRFSVYTQLLSYNSSSQDEYGEHTDCSVDPHEYPTRAWTFLLYLNDVPEGGGTSFPKLNLTIAPKKGR